jgi:hypothetical protein
MRPGVEHVVYTLSDSILTGGHFYSKSTLSQSLRTGLQEHKYGRYSTNTEHLGSEAILHRLMGYYGHLIEMAVNENFEDGE